MLRLRFCINRSLSYSVFSKLYHHNTEKGKPATEKHLAAALDLVLAREHYGYSGAWELLTTTQRRLLLALADPEYPAIPLFSNEFARRFNFRSVSTIQRAITALKDKDFIDQSEDQYILSDRFFKRGYNVLHYNKLQTTHLAYRSLRSQDLRLRRI